VLQTEHKILGIHYKSLIGWSNKAVCITLCFVLLLVFRKRYSGHPIIYADFFLEFRHSQLIIFLIEAVVVGFVFLKCSFGGAAVDFLFIYENLFILF
jgi:hypothetical protein